MWDWHSFFVKIGIPASVSSRYAEIFRQNRVSKDMLPDLDKATLADLGVTAVGDQLAILKHARDEAYDMEPDSPSKLRVRIAGPGAGAGHSSNGSSGSSEQRRGRPAPDRSEIYHIKMPEGSTARTKEIMQNASVLRKHGSLPAFRTRRSLVQDDYFVDEEGLSAEEEEYMDEEMAWEDLEEEELDEEVEELVDEFAYVEERPSVYNRLSR
ncbi:unnamed protein product [Heligmosomoides polygyrus]|uniref:SAM domain-containing protein n=2 Tax=Heligmosomoides polygyrus TaxID=6339 RepID=A0A183GL34_HELPZ|nr:unnamed protein product [Heligmosomoides polygyrus]